MAKKKQRLRIPRPLGLTALCQNYHNAPDQTSQHTIKEKIKNQIIHEWMSNGMYLNNVNRTPEDIAILLNIRTEEVLIRMNKEVGRLGEMLNSGEKGQLARALLFKAIFWALDGYHKMSNQASILISQQGNKYVPFLTSEVTKAIGQLPIAQKGLLETIKLLSDGSPGTVINNNFTAQTNENKAFITVDSAINILKNNGSLSMLEDVSLVAPNMPKMELPNIDARHQDLTNTGLIFKRNEASQLPELRHDGTREMGRNGTLPEAE